MAQKHSLTSILANGVTPATYPILVPTSSNTYLVIIVTHHLDSRGDRLYSWVYFDLEVHVSEKMTWGNVVSGRHGLSENKNSIEDQTVGPNKSLVRRRKPIHLSRCKSEIFYKVY